MASIQPHSASADHSARLALLAAVIAERKREALAPRGKLLDFARWYFPEREGMEFLVILRKFFACLRPFLHDLPGCLKNCPVLAPAGLQNIKKRLFPALSCG